MVNSDFRSHKKGDEMADLISIDQIGELLTVLKASRMTRAELNQLLASKSLGAFLEEFIDGITYTITVGIHGNLEAMIAAGKYSWHNNDLNEENFPIDRRKDGRIQKIKLLPFNGSMLTAAALKGRDLNLGGIEVVCALGERYPELQRGHGLLALGSEWNRHVPYLEEFNGERRLSLWKLNPQKPPGQSHRFPIIVG